MAASIDGSIRTLSSSDFSQADFMSWLKKKLIDHNTDDEIFSPYIVGILEGDDSEEETLEALEGILAEIIENDIRDLSSEIFKKWSFIAEAAAEDEKCVAKLDVDKKLAKLMEERKVQAAPVNLVSRTTTEQKKLKEAILAQYAVVSDGDENDEDSATTKQTSSGLMKNTNAEAVLRAEREKRDKEKEDSHKKREKDKEDRTKQKSKDEERKEKEKKRTQKGEKRR